MFYCEDCAKERGWPTDLYLPLSRGGCEICHKGAVCFDVPSAALPPSQPENPERMRKLESYARKRRV